MEAGITLIYQHWGFIWHESDLLGGMYYDLVSESEDPWRKEFSPMGLQDIPGEVHKVDENDEVLWSGGLESLYWIWGTKTGLIHGGVTGTCLWLLEPITCNFN